MQSYVRSSAMYNRQDLETAKCPLEDEWIKKQWYIYTMEYYAAGSTKKEETLTFCNSVDGPGEYYAK